MKSKVKSFILGMAFMFAISLCCLSYGTAYFQLAKVEYPIFVAGVELIMELPVLNYEGNTYIPLRKLAEVSGAKVEWDSENSSVKITPWIKSAVITPPILTITPIITPTPLSEDAKKYEEVQGFTSLIKINNSLYSCSDLSKSPQRISKDSSNKYYFSVIDIAQLLPVAFNDYEIKNTGNQFLNGNIVPNPIKHPSGSDYIVSDYCRVNEKQVSLREIYKEMYFINKDGSKKYYLSKGIVGQEKFENGFDGEFISIDDIMKYFDIKYRLEVDEKEKLLIFSFDNLK